MVTTASNPQSESERVLHIRFKRSNTGRIEETLQALDDGTDVEPYFECTFRDLDQLHQVTRPTNLELLRTIAREDPAGIRALARLVDRDIRQVHRNLDELESLGLIEFEENGQAKQPTVWYDSISVDLPLFELGGEHDTVDA